MRVKSLIFAEADSVDSQTIGRFFLSNGHPSAAHVVHIHTSIVNKKCKSRRTTIAAFRSLFIKTKRYRRARRSTSNMGMGRVRSRVALAWCWIAAFVCGTSNAFVPPVYSHAFERPEKHKAAFRISMVRNIDLPECLVFYGVESFRTNDVGLRSLLDECEQTGTAVVLIGNQAQFTAPLLTPVQFRATVHPPPNPYDLLVALESVTIQPRPFGGSAGFGQKPADPERTPLPARTVVLCTTLDQTRAARAVGTRVVCLEDNDLADAVVDGIDFWLDDIATPGSFWLNPPHPKDDQGNKVDPEWLVENYLLPEQHECADRIDDGKDIDEDDMRRILADLAPLQ